jgi:hypothetical protein
MCDIRLRYQIALTHCARTDSSVCGTADIETFQSLVYATSFAGQLPGKRVSGSLDWTGTFNRLRRLRTLSNPQPELPTMWTHNRPIAADNHHWAIASLLNEYDALCNLISNEAYRAERWGRNIAFCCWPKFRIRSRDTEQHRSSCLFV